MLNFGVRSDPVETIPGALNPESPAGCPAGCRAHPEGIPAVFPWRLPTPEKLRNPAKVCAPGEVLRATRHPWKRLEFGGDWANARPHKASLVRESAERKELRGLKLCSIAESPGKICKVAQPVQFEPMCSPGVAPEARAVQPPSCTEAQPSKRPSTQHRLKAQISPEKQSNHLTVLAQVFVQVSL